MSLKMIDIKDFVTLLEPGWVAMDKDNDWYWFRDKPKLGFHSWYVDNEYHDKVKLKREYYSVVDPYKHIRPVENWKESLLRITDGKMIDITDVIKFLKPGWVVMEKNSIWWWFEDKPKLDLYGWYCRKGYSSQKLNDNMGFSFQMVYKHIRPVENWKKSLLEMKKTS